MWLARRLRGKESTTLPIRAEKSSKRSAKAVEFIVGSRNNSLLAFCTLHLSFGNFQLLSSPARSLASYLPLADFHAELPHFAVEVAAVEAELFGGGGHIAAGALDVAL